MDKVKKSEYYSQTVLPSNLRNSELERYGESYE